MGVRSSPAVLQRASFEDLVQCDSDDDDPAKLSSCIVVMVVMVVMVVVLAIV